MRKITVFKSIMLSMISLFPGYHLFGQTAIKQVFPQWEQGFLDIHHINTGEGNSTFVQMPDGTTLLVDVGTVDKAAFEDRHFPLKATVPVPNNSLSAGEKVAKYMGSMSKKVEDTRQVDFLVITHFHSDHFGGLTDFVKEITPAKIIDRDYPSYSFPFDLKEKLQKDVFFQRYMDIVSSGRFKVEQMAVGSTTQIGLQQHKLKYPLFSIHNIKNGAQLWNPQEGIVHDLFSVEDMLNGGYNENPLSMAFKISYGDFDYYLGADNTGLQDSSLPVWFDVETPLAASIGKVDAMALNHHGNRDANNATFIATLDPKVAVQQVYCSDQPGQEVFYRLQRLGRGKGRHLYATNMHPETRATYGPWFDKAYKSMQGHVVIRVYPDGKNFRVYVLDESDLTVKNEGELLKAEL